MSHHAFDYVTDLTPGSGRRTPARSWFETDASTLDLDGSWSFRLSPGLSTLDDAVLDPDFDDRDWDRIPVPAHWVLEGDGRYGSPAYTNVQYPFPLDPPYVPDANPTGDYRRRFDGPEWPGGRTLLRFDGVESVYRVWLNGIEVGVGKGSRLVQEFDVTDLVQPGSNVLVVRVHQWSSMSYLEDQDQWWLPGIFRSVTLRHRPVGAIDDVWVRAGFADGQGSLGVELTAAAEAYPITVSLPELGTELIIDSAEAAGRSALAPGTDVGPVQPWTAEQPRRYRVVVTSAGEKIEFLTGFRTVRIVDAIFTVNGRAVTFRGVNRHETHPVRGRVFDHDHARSDMIMMKQHGVNAIRTSHYPPHPGVLDLADELGFWVIDECDLETHGFVYDGWRRNPSDDPDWRDAYLDRIERTVERDKNHPSIVIWSLGNESGTGVNLAAMSAWVHARDPERPVHYEGDYTCAYTDVYSRMYPNLKETAAIGGETGALLACSPAEARRVRSKPFLLCEYAHAMGNGPGAFAEYDELATRFPRLHGGFVWEWRDHGLLTRTPDGTPYYAYGGDYGEVVHDGNFVMDGMVLPDDTATPSLAEFAAVNQPLVITVAEDVITIGNRQHSRDSSHLRFVIIREIDGEPDLQVDLPVPVVAAGDSVTLPFPTAWPTPGQQGRQGGDGRDDGEVWLTIRAELAADEPWAPAGHVVAWAQVDRSAVRPVEVPARRRPSGSPASPGTGAVRLGPATFAADTGRLTELFGLAVDGPQLELWRGPTDNDRAADRGSYELGDPDDGDGDGAPGPSSEQRWRARGLDRLVHRVRSVTADDSGVRVEVRVGAANSARVVDLVQHWTVIRQGTGDATGDGTGDELDLRVDVLPRSDGDCTWPRVGIRFTLPATVDHASWFGTGPLESYPDSRRAARVGRFAGGIDELNVVYSRPQETGHRAELRSLVLSDAEAPRLRLRTFAAPSGHRPGFTFTRHTPQQLDAARHPYELGTPTASYLFIDDAVHGLGSRACGFDVLPQHALWPGAHSFGLRFSAP